MKHNPTIKAFLNAVNTWKAYVKALAKVNKANCNKARGLLMKAMFHWRKEAERLKAIIDNTLRG